MLEKLERYPESEDCTYYVEFFKWPGHPYTWTLFKTQKIYSDEEYEKLKKKNCLLCQYGHPWNLASGEVNENKNAMDLNAKSFLIFLVDSLNNNTEKPDAINKSDLDFLIKLQKIEDRSPNLDTID